jgi:methionyl-tRNA synthetase
MEKKFYITTPIYYVNDIPHIGHAYTTIAADVLARYHRLIGDDTYYLTGTDEHGTKIAEAAECAGKTPQEFCDEKAATFEFLWDRLDISNDQFIRTTSNVHKKGVEKFLTKLKEADAIYEGQYEGLYCTGCEKFMTEKELVDGKCPDHQKEPEVVREKNYFFKLSKYLPQVKEMIDKGKIKIIPESRKKEVLGLFKQGLDDFSISRESVKWGIQLPFDKSQVSYVWAEALQNYITAIGYEADDKQFSKLWPADIHLMAKDIIKFHAVSWPAMLLAAGLEMPKVIYAHGFFTVDGKKMSKSLGNVIDPNALIDEFGADATRYLLLSQFPFGNDGDVKAGEFAIQYNADLANGIGNLVSRVTSMTEKYFDSKVPETDTYNLEAETTQVWGKYKEAMKIFQIDGAISAVKELNGICDAYIEQNKPWELAKDSEDKLAVVLYNLLEAIRHLGLMIYPILPETAEKIQVALGQCEFNSQDFKKLSKWGGLKSGIEVKKGEALFPRLEAKED